MTRGEVRIPERREASIEAATCRKIKQRWPKVLIRKLSGPSDRHWPDRVFFFRNDLVIFVEFKRPGQPLTKGQAHQIEQLQDLGFICVIGFNVEDVVGHIGNLLWQYHYDN